MRRDNVQLKHCFTLVLGMHPTSLDGRRVHATDVALPRAPRHTDMTEPTAAVNLTLRGTAGAAEPSLAGYESD